MVSTVVVNHAHQPAIEQLSLLRERVDSITGDDAFADYSAGQERIRLSVSVTSPTIPKRTARRLF
jgi:hypothetical protein